MLVTNEQKDLMVTNLKAFRVLFGLSAEDLARYLDCTRQSIANFENGHSRLPTVWYIAIKSVFDHLAVESDFETLGLYEYGLEHPLQIVRKGNSLKNFIKTSTVEKA